MILKVILEMILEMIFVGFVNIMSSTDPNLIKPSASYVYHSFKRRDAILSDNCLFIMFTI